MSLETDILTALQLISNDKTKCQNNFYHIYPFTTENLNGYFSKLDLVNKDILTTGSSGDQILNAISMGCKSITCFDINPFVKYYYELKKAAIENLEYDEFFEFFCTKRCSKKNYNDYISNFDTKLYKKLSSFLTPTTKKFWDSLFLNFNNFTIRTNLFFSDEESSKILKKINYYLNEENYYDLRKKLKSVNVEFLECDIKELPNKLNKKYDYIFLSNIMQNMKYMYESEGLKELRDLLINLKEFLNENGEIEVCYLYKFNKNKKYSDRYSDIYKLNKFCELFDTDEIYFIKTKCIKNINYPSLKKDYAIMYKKIK